VDKWLGKRRGIPNPASSWCSRYRTRSRSHPCLRSSTLRSEFGVGRFGGCDYGKRRRRRGGRATQTTKAANNPIETLLGESGVVGARYRGAGWVVGVAHSDVDEGPHGEQRLEPNVLGGGPAFCGAAPPLTRCLCASNLHCAAALDASPRWHTRSALGCFSESNKDWFVGFMDKNRTTFRNDPCKDLKERLCRLESVRAAALCPSSSAPCQYNLGIASYVSSGATTPAAGVIQHGTLPKWSRLNYLREVLGKPKFTPTFPGTP
jgi:hypothetical protein